MGSEEAAILGIVLAVVLGIVKVLGVVAEGLFYKIKKVDKNGHFTHADRARNELIHEILSKCDTDGTPLIYSPREIQRAILKEMQSNTVAILKLGSEASVLNNMIKKGG